MEPCRLAAKNLACRRGDRVLFAGLSLELEQGEAMQVTGANGTGKSSLIRLLAGLLRPFAGEVDRKGGLALVDERLALDEHMPLGPALAFWGRLDGGDAMAVACAAMQVDALLDVPVRYLSTGQRKRAALARLLCADAPIWLLDEPLNGLDRDARGMVGELVAGHCARGGIAVVASHQPLAVLDLETLDVAGFAP